MIASRVIAVASGKGGVGKSTVALNLAIALRSLGSNVGILDADLYAPNIPAMVGLTRRVPATSLLLWSRTQDRDVTAVPQRYGVGIMSAQFLLGEDQGLTIGSDLVALLLERLVSGVDWGALDYLVVDLLPGTADLQQMIVRRLGLAGVVMVVTPQDVAHLDARKALELFKTSQVRVFGGVENMSGLRCSHCGEELELFPKVASDRSVWAAGVERLVAIPFSPEVAHAAEVGFPVALASPESDIAGRFQDLAARIMVLSGGP